MYDQISSAGLCSPIREQSSQWDAEPSTTPSSNVSPHPPLIKTLKDQEMGAEKHIIVRHLIESRVDINFINDKKKTALVYAIRHTEIPIIQTLLEAKANPYLSTTLIHAILMKSMEKINILLQASKAFNPSLGVKFLLEQRDQFDQTPLIWAIAQRNINLVALLLGQNADVHATDRRGNSPLIHAASPSCCISEMQQSSIVSLLLEARANLNHCNARGHQALFYARKFRQKIVCQQLLDAGARLPFLQFHDHKNKVKEIREKVEYPIYDILEFAKALLIEAQIPFSERHFSVHHPLVTDLKEALDMASELMTLDTLSTQGTLGNRYNLKLHCLLTIIKEKYKSQYQVLTDEQIEDAIDQKAQIQAKTLKPEDYDYIDYDQAGLEAAIAAYFAKKKEDIILDAAKQQLPTCLVYPPRPNYIVLRHRIFGQGTTDWHYASLRKAVRQRLL